MKTPEFDDPWMPSMPFPLTQRELNVIAAEERAVKEALRLNQQLKNEEKNQRRKEAQALKQHIPKKRVEAGKRLRHAFGGAFGHAPDNIKFMAAQGTTMTNKEENNG